MEREYKIVVMPADDNHICVKSLIEVDGYLAAVLKDRNNDIETDPIEDAAIENINGKIFSGASALMCLSKHNDLKDITEFGNAIQSAHALILDAVMTHKRLMGISKDIHMYKDE